ncbi:MAG: TMEM175 family protein [Pseudomonadota bacterium]|nr:TMEM175 family protein [Pseudomonadota bacterium]
MNSETDLARISRIGDSVFAVTITLLAYRVRIPGPDLLETGDLAALAPFFRDLGAVALSFFVASMFYVSHWRVFRRMRQSDIQFVVLNMAFLGALILLPISTSLVSGDPTRFGTLAYSANLFLAATASLFLRRHARRIDPQAFGPGRLLLTPAISMVLFGAAFLASFYSPTASLALWICTIVSPWIDRRWGIGSPP